MKKQISYFIAAISIMISCFCFFACSGAVTEENQGKNNASPIEKSNVTAKIFIPDYQALSEGRAVAPQTTQVRLSSGTTVIDTLELKMSDVKAVDGMPSDLPGGVWTGTFSKVTSGQYAKGSLTIELLDAADNVITSGSNEQVVTVFVGETAASAEFFTIPVVLSDTGSITSGEMAFSKLEMLGGEQYRLSIDATGTYPDIVIFNPNGTYNSYAVIDDASGDVDFTPDADGTYFFGFYADDGDVTSYTFKSVYNGTSYPKTVTENFEDFDNTVYNWVKSGTYEVSSTFAKSGSKSFRMSCYPYKSATLSLTVIVNEESAVSFNFKPEGNATGQGLKFFIDSEIKNSWSGAGIWMTYSAILTKGVHTLQWQTVSGSSYKADSENAYFIDDISVIPNVTDKIEITPKGVQQIVVGDSITYSARALRSDGSIRDDVDFTYEASSGSFTSNIFTPSAAGSVTITAKDGAGHTAIGNATVLAADYMRDSFAYNGITYNGMAAGGTGTVTSNIVTYPTVTTFDADGFFTIEGSVDNADCYNYAYIKLVKNDDNTLTSSYFVRGDFKTRIWLRFGTGNYTVTVYKLNSIDVDLDGDGDITGSYSFIQDCIFTVTNTHNEVGVDNDGRWIYPSGVVQSDDIAVMNLAANLTAGLTTDRDKILALHDYVVTSKYYDNDSLAAGCRKKQDAVSVIKNGTCVCEGYANLMTALLRTSGIESKVVSSSSHAWNNIYVDDTWLFLDATWDDPTPDGGEYYVRYKYYLLEDLGGVNNDHSGSDVIGRSLDIDPVPKLKGMPDGWY